MKEFFKLNIYSLVLLAMIVVTAASVYCQFKTFAQVHTADPLKNIQVKVVDPVYTNSKEIVWSGNFDRDVACKLIKFHVLLKNKETGSIIMLGPQHLTRTPKSGSSVGKQIPINFALKTPDTIYPGNWSSVFEADYLCYKGIFKAIRHVSDPVDNFIVKKPE
jgi:hypothetical protein